MGDDPPRGAVVGDEPADRPSRHWPLRSRVVVYGSTSDVQVDEDGAAPAATLAELVAHDDVEPGDVDHGVAHRRRTEVGAPGYESVAPPDGLPGVAASHRSMR